MPIVLTVRCSVVPETLSRPSRCRRRCEYVCVGLFECAAAALNCCMYAAGVHTAGVTNRKRDHRSACVPTRQQSGAISHKPDVASRLDIAAAAAVAVATTFTMRVTATHAASRASTAVLWTATDAMGFQPPQLEDHVHRPASLAPVRLHASLHPAVAIGCDKRPRRIQGT